MLNYLFDADYNKKEIFFIKPKRKTSRHFITVEDCIVADCSIAFNRILEGEKL